jgi:hypothetical protein
MLLSGPPNGGGPLSRLPATLSGGTTPRNPPVRAIMLGGQLAAFAMARFPGWARGPASAWNSVWTCPGRKLGQLGVWLLWGV